MLVKSEPVDGDEGVKPPSKRQKRSRSRSQKLEETKEAVDIKVKKQKTKDRKMKGVAQFFEDEADEGDESEVPVIKDGK